MSFTFAISMRWTVAILVTVAAGILALAGDGRSGGPGSSALALQQTNFDQFEHRDFWYADRYSNNAIDLFPLDRTYSTAGATLEQGESAPCAPITSSIWIAYSADRAGRLDVAVAGSGFDATVTLYEWDLTGDLIPSPPGADLIPIACAEQASGAEATASMNIAPGREYLVQLGSRAGGGDVRVRATCAGCAPPNDNFQSQHYLYVDQWQPEARRTVDTTAATTEPGEQQPCGQIGATVWYSMYAGTPAEVEISTEGSNFDTTLAVYRLRPSSNYEWNLSNLELIACDDNGAGPASVRLQHDPERGGEYFVQAGGANGAKGSLVVSARCVPYCPPYNDNAASAEYWDVPIQGYQIPTQGATIEDGEPQPCGDVGHTVWFQITARGDTRIALNTAGSDFETSVAVYENASFSPPPGEFEVIDCDAGGAAAVEFAANGNQPYWVQIGGVDDASGMLVTNADCVPAPCPPYNDSIVQPAYFWRPYGSQFYTEFFDVRGATTEPGEPLDCGDMGRTTWWVIDTYEPLPVIPFAFDTRDSDFDTEIAVYEAPLYGGEYGASPFDSMTRIACASDGSGNRARATFDAQPNKRYYVQIGGRGGATGQLGVEISCNGPCPAENDMVGGALYAFAPFSHTIDTRATTTEPDEPLPCGNMGKTVWYRIDAGAGAEFTISTAGSDFPTVIAAYETPPWTSPPGGSSGPSDVGCLVGDTLEYAGAAGSSYLIQVGGVDGASGSLQLSIDCEPADSCRQQVYPVDTGQGGIAGVPGGSVSGPDTGSGGHKARPGD